MKIKDIAKKAKARPGTRIRITHANLVDDEGRMFYTPALTEAQIVAYSERIVAVENDEGRTIYCTVT